MRPEQEFWRKKAHKNKLFALVNVQMALGQTAGCPRVNRAKKVYVFASKHRKHKLLPLVNLQVVPGLSRLSKSLCIQNLCAFFLALRRGETRLRGPEVWGALRGLGFRPLV